VIPYLVTFAISILVCAAGELTLRKSRIGGAILCALSTLFPTVLAGARDFKVGTDVATYGNFVFQAARYSMRLTYFLRTHKEIETLYKALAFAISRYTNNPHWLYFATALIICGFTMCGLLYYRRWCSVTLGWACFLFLFYGDTLNTMRQCLALAIVFAAFPLFLEKKYILYCAVSVIGVMFHVTGVLALLVPVVYLFMKKVPPRWLQFFMIVVFMGVILFYSPLLGVVLKWNLLPSKFYRYMAEGVAFALNPTVLRIPFLLPIIMYYDRFCNFMEMTEPWGTVSGGTELRLSDTREISKEQAMGMMVVVMLLLEICTVQLRSVRPALYRISYYFSYYRFIAYSRVIKILRKDNRAIVTIALFIYLVVLWYYQNVIQGNNEIYPYVYAHNWFHRIIYIMPAE
jgi:hypothetical protein